MDVVGHKRVLVILPVSFDVRHRGVGGGVAITYQRLAHVLEQRGHHVTVLSTWKTLDGVESFVSGRYRDIASSWHNVKLIEQEVARHDVAVLIGGTAICWIHLLCHRQKLPVVFTHHTAVEKIPVPWWIWWASGILYGMQMTLAMNLATLALTVSRDSAAEVRSRGTKVDGIIDQAFKCQVFAEADAPETIRQIRARFCRLTGRKRIALYAGRWSFEKEIGKLIPPLPSDYGLIIVGDGPARYVAHMHHLSIRLGLVHVLMGVLACTHGHRRRLTCLCLHDHANSNMKLKR